MAQGVVRFWLRASFLGLLLVALCCSPSSGDWYRIARDPTFFPLNLGGRERSILAFSDEIVRAISKEEDFEMALYDISWPNLEPALFEGRVEAILSGLPPIPTYREVYAFSDPYLYIGPVLVVQEGVTVHSIDEMPSKIIGVLPGSASMVLVARIPGVVIRDYMTPQAMFLALSRGEVDGLVINALEAYSFVRNLYPGMLQVVTPPLTDDALRLITMKGKHDELIDRFNKGLKAIEEDGEYRDLRVYWGL